MNEGHDSHIPVPDIYSPDMPMIPRHCHDATMNTYGNNLLNLCKVSGLRILNGRKLGDSLGKFTCHEYGGSSTVDYIGLLAHYNIFEDIPFFKVNEWLGHASDHCMIECGLHATVHPGCCSNMNKLSNLNPCPLLKVGLQVVCGVASIVQTDPVVHRYTRTH